MKRFITSTTDFDKAREKDRRFILSTTDFDQARKSSNDNKRSINEIIHGPTKELKHLNKESSARRKIPAHVLALHDKLKANYDRGKYNRYDPHPDHQAVLDYTRTSSVLNEHLRHVASVEAKGETYVPRLYDTEIEHKKNSLDRALKSDKPLKHKIHVYTGIPKSPHAIHKDIFHKEHEGDSPLKSHLPAFTSTSINFHTAHGFCQSDRDKNSHMLKIHLPKGSNHGRYIGHESKFSKEHDREDHQVEHEYLIRRNAKINIHPVPEIHEHHVYGEDYTPEKGFHKVKTLHRVHIWHASIQDDEHHSNGSSGKSNSAVKRSDKPHPAAKTIKQVAKAKNTSFDKQAHVLSHIDKTHNTSHAAQIAKKAAASSGDRMTFANAYYYAKKHLKAKS